MRIKLIFFALLFLFTTTENFAQFTFSVSPGLDIKGANFGYQINNRLVPYISIQYANLNFDIQESGRRNDFLTDEIVSFSETNEFSANIFIPNIGLKYFIIEKEDLKAYLSGNISKPLIGGKLEIDGEEDERLEDDIEAFDFFGAEFGFGAEYFFSKHFSIGGEFGLRHFRTNISTTDEIDLFDPETGNFLINDTIDYTANASFSPTYSRIYLNFYFGFKD